MRKLRLLVAALLAGLIWPAGVGAQQALPPGEGILADYAAEFSKCDQQNTFNGRQMTGSRRCSGDPNRLVGFRRLPGGAITFRAKLSLDIDGGWKACSNPGATDQCPTSYIYEAWRGKPTAQQKANWQEAFVTADLVPYIVTPLASNAADVATREKESAEFQEKTGISVGDLGVVRHGDLVIPVFVADGGPHNKIGEGSLALFDALGDTRCKEREPSQPKFCKVIKDFSLEDTVETIIFPGSSIAGLTPSDTNAKVAAKAMELYEALLDQ
jgi:hypothetical protein